MSMKAKALGQYNDAAMLSQIMEILPQFAHAVSLPLSKTSEIVINSSKNDCTIGDGINHFLTQVPPSVKALSGIDLNQYLHSKLDPKTKSSIGEGSSVPN